MDGKSKNSRIIYIDLLNILSCFAVVVLHCSGKVFAFDSSKSWWLSIILQSAAHFSIPCFFMLCGANLLEYRKRQNTEAFLKRRIIRIGIPFLFWSIVYMIFNHIIGYSRINSIISVADKLINNGVENIFWFFYAIIGIYLFIPALSVIIENASRKLLWYLCALCFIGASVIRAFNTFSGLTVSPYFVLPMSGGYIGYVLLGFMLKTSDIKKHIRFIIYLLGLFGFAVMVFGTYYLSAKKGSTDPSIMDYNSICCYMISTAVFVFFKSLTLKPDNGFVKIISKLSSLSLGVYILQMFALILFEQYFRQYVSSWHYMLWAPILIYSLLAAVTYVLKKIPIIRNLIP